ncbi:hypothetical protein AB0I60_35530 [Actinosynnema sp. NPDC050436]|uniref:tetratricopeptide repeat protein n=1 Tax=Actinosynnema sp. NPDC050436 TaxID=3155659 RepID=UPI0033F9AFD5
MPKNNGENSRLRALLRDAKWTNQNLALAVNSVAAEVGIVLRYDRTTVSHWLSGSKPRSQVVTFVVEAFARRLGRFLSPSDLGMAHEDQGRLPEADESSGMAALHDLLATDLDATRRVWMTELPFRIDWAEMPPWQESPREKPASTHDKVSRGKIVAVNRIASAFAEVDAAFGGGTARGALMAYLATDVLGCRHPHMDRNSERKLLATASLLTTLLAFKCFDNLEHGLTQRYHRVALKLAEESGDLNEHLRVLCGMSVQAGFLGHHAQAARLAHRAIGRADGGVQPDIYIALLGQAAVSYAALAQCRYTAMFLARADRHIEDVVSTRTLDSTRADLAYRAGHALLQLRDYARAERRLQESLRLRTDDERRSRLLATHLLADLHLRQRNLDQACSVWTRFLDEYHYVQSRRVTTAFLAFQRKLHAYRQHPTVRRVLTESERLAG